MTPSNSSLNATYMSYADSEHIGESGPGKGAGLNLNNIRSFEFGRTLGFAFRLAILFLAVVHVAFLSSKEKMGRVGAFRVVAFVKNGLSVWDFSIVNHPRNSTCNDWVSAWVLASHYAISLMLKCFPFPTRLNVWKMKRNSSRFINFLPKAFYSLGIHRDMTPQFLT